MREIKFRAFSNGQWWYSDDEAYLLKEYDGELFLVEDTQFYLNDNPRYAKIGKAIQFKECVSCKLPKTLDLFSVQANTKDGLRGSCKTCMGIRNRKYHADNKVTLNHKRRERKRLMREKKAAKANIIKPVKIFTDIDRIKEIQAIMAVPINVLKTQAHYMAQQHKETQKRINIR